MTVGITNRKHLKHQISASRKIPSDTNYSVYGCLGCCWYSEIRITGQAAENAAVISVVLLISPNRDGKVLCSSRGNFSAIDKLHTKQMMQFVYFQVNNGVLYFLDYVEDIYIMVISVLVSIQSDTKYKPHLHVLRHNLCCFMFF